MRTALAILALLLAAGCGSTSGPWPADRALLPDTTVRLAPSTSVALEKIVNWGLYAGVAYLVLDPLAPNWHIEEAPLADGHVHLSLKMKRYYSGGAGEARAVFQRRARELARYNGFDDFQVVEYQEGMEGSVLGSQRTAEGVIRLTRKGG